MIIGSINAEIKCDQGRVDEIFSFMKDWPATDRYEFRAKVTAIKTYPTETVVNGKVIPEGDVYAQGANTVDEAITCTIGWLRAKQAAGFGFVLRKKPEIRVRDGYHLRLRVACVPMADCDQGFEIVEE